MAIKSLSKTKHLITIWRRDADGKRRKSEITVSGSLRDAKRYEADLKAEKKAGNLVAQKRHSGIPVFEDFAETWYQVYVIPTNSASEHVSKRISLDKHLLPYFRGRLLSEIRAIHLEEYKAATLKTGLSPRTVNLHLSHLKKLFRCAVDWEVLDRSPADTVSKIKDRSEKWSYLDRDEARKFMEVVPQRWYPLFLTAIQTGMRKGELLALRWQDINWSNGLINVRHTLGPDETLKPPKSTAGLRSIPMTPEVREALSGLRKDGIGSEFVFCTSKGTHIHSRNLKRVLDAINAKSGVKRLRFHDLRHTFASHLAMAGVPLRTIRDLLGHSTLEMTLRYAHIDGQTLDAAIVKLSDWTRTESTAGSDLADTIND